MKKTIAFFLLMMAFFVLSCSVNAADSVNMSMEVYNSNGELIEEKSDLKAGDYNVTVGVLNLDENQKDIEVFVAVKDGGVLKSVSKKISTINQKPVSKFFEVTIPVTINESGSGISLEAYCWNNGLVPYSEKVIFGEPKYEKFEVYGRITGTYRTDSSLDANEVKFNVEKSDNFDGYEYEYESAVFKMKYENDNAYNMMFQYAKAIVLKDEDGNYTLTSVSILDNDVYKTSAILCESFTNNSITFLKSESGIATETFMLNMTAEVFVNGVRIGALGSSYLDNYLFNNDCGTVTLIDATETGSTDKDGIIDYIFIDYYVDAVVDSVVEGEIYKIYFSDMNANVKNLTIDTTDEDVIVTYTLDGKAIEYTELQKGDVLSFAYDVCDRFEYSIFYDITVSRDKVSGMVTEVNENSLGIEYFVINGEKYSAAASMYGSVNGEWLYAGTDYILYLNAFGNFVKYEENVLNKNISILDSAYTDSSGTPYIKLITSDGQKVSYPVKENRYEEFAEYIYNTSYGNTSIGLYASSSDKKPIEERIVEYNVNQLGYITKIEPVTRAFVTTGEYKAYSMKINNLSFNENTVVIDLTSSENSNDLTDINKVSKRNMDWFIDGCEYEICAANNSYDNTYYYIAVLDGGMDYPPYTPVCIAESVEYNNDEGEYYLNYYTNGSGDIKTVKFEEYDRLVRGDVFVFTEEDGYVTDFVKLLNADMSDSDAFVDSVKDSVLNVMINDKIVPQLCTMPEDWLYTNATTKAGNVEFAFGVITKKIGDIEIGVSPIYDGRIVHEVPDFYAINSGTNYYTNDENGIKPATFSDIVPTLIPDGDDGSILTDNGYRKMNFAFIKLVDGVAQDIYAIGNGFDVVIPEVPEDDDNKIIGIFDQASIDSSDTPKIRIITADGQKVSYPVKDNSKSKYNELAQYGYNTSYGTSTGLYAPHSDKKPLEERIVEYTVNSSGYITKITPLSDIMMVTGEYFESSNRINGCIMDNDIKVIDLSSADNNADFSDINRVFAANKDYFEDGEIYEVYFADKSSIGNYRFAVVIMGASAYNAKTNIAVYKSASSVYDENEGCTLEALNILQDGEEKSINLAPYLYMPSLKPGDVFIYDTDSDGYVSEIIFLYSGNARTEYQYFVQNVKDIMSAIIDGSQSALGGEKLLWNGITGMPMEWIYTDNTNRVGNVEILFGVITDKKNNYVSVAQIENGERIDKNNAVDYIIRNNANVYVYDYSQPKESNRLSIGTLSSIVKTDVPQWEEYVDYNGNPTGIFDIVTYDNYYYGEYREMNFIFAKVVDGDIAEALVIKGSNV